MLLIDLTMEASFESALRKRVQSSTIDVLVQEGPLDIFKLLKHEHFMKLLKRYKADSLPIGQHAVLMNAWYELSHHDESQGVGNHPPEAISQSRSASNISSASSSSTKGDY